MMLDVREYTNKLLEMIEEGMLNRDMVIMAFVKYMSEDDVKNMMFINEMIEEEYEWSSGRRKKKVLKEYIVAEVRVQADTSEELKQMLDDGCKVADDKCYLLNNGGE